MDLRRKIKKIVAIFYFSPRGRKIRDAWEYVQRMRMDPTLVSNKRRMRKMKGNLRELVEIMTETLAERYENRKTYELKLKKILYNPMKSRKDSIHDPKVLEMIRIGFERMEQSQDPCHDISHVYRCIRIAKLYFSFFRLKRRLDWGAMVLALAWHDISRADDPGLIYRSKILKPLESLPWVVDLSLILNGMSDAERSYKIFKQEAEQIGLSEAIKCLVEVGILATSTNRQTREWIKKAGLSCKIISDIDALDMCTIGRFEAALKNILDNKMASIKYFNRMNLLGSYVVKRFQNKWELKCSNQFYDFFSVNLEKHAYMFYPNDAEILAPN